MEMKEALLEKRNSLINFWKENGVVQDRRLLQAFAEVPREAFVPHLVEYAYEDRPLPTGRGQSLSQPTTIMVMTQALEVKPGQKVFEVGAGVGYQASLLAKLVGRKGKVITTDVMPELIHITRKNMERLGLDNVIALEADGSQGLPGEAPFDRVLITAACPEIPPPLIEQTKEGGIIVAPVGDRQEQMMVKAIKKGAGLELEFLGSFVFVPMQGKHGFKVEEDGIDIK